MTRESQAPFRTEPGVFRAIVVVATFMAMTFLADQSHANFLDEPRETLNAVLASNLSNGSDAAVAPAGVTLLYFTQQQCPPCRQMQPMLDHLIERGFPLQVVDATANPDIVRQYQVLGTPTFVLLKDGQELKRHSGVLSSYQINSLLIDAGHVADQNVLTKPTALSPIVNFFDRLRPAARQTGRELGSAKLAPSTVDPTATIDWAELTSAERQALQATGRLKIEYQDRGQSVTDYGTATVIHRKGPDILLLTCGHVFRDSQGQGTIRVELDFSDGQPKETVLGQLLMFDAGAPDVALVAARTNLPIQPMPITSADFRPERGQLAFSVGCDQGAPATVRRGEHLAIVRCGAVQVPGQPSDDRMARKFAVHGRPVVGRSGGGLFTADGYLIGVCNAAVVGSNEGRYSAIDNVHALLEQARLAHVIGNPTTTNQASAVARPRFVPIVDLDSTGLAQTEATGERPFRALGQSRR